METVDWSRVRVSDNHCKLRLNVMSTNLEYRERERQRKRGRRQASEAQLEKKSEEELERETNKGDIFCWKNNMKIL